jgi:hypothetical protein
MLIQWAIKVNVENVIHTCIDAEPKGRRGYQDVVESQYSEAFDFLPQMP